MHKFHIKMQSEFPGLEDGRFDLMLDNRGMIICVEDTQDMLMAFALREIHDFHLEEMKAEFTLRGKKVTWLFTELELGQVLHQLAPSFSYSETYKDQHHYLYEIYGNDGKQDQLLINAIIAITVVVYFLSGGGLDAPSIAQSYQWGAWHGPSHDTGEWWRSFSSAFLHAGPVHLILNMYFLHMIGKMSVRILGPAKFIAFYLLCAWTASLASYYFSYQSLSVGASGAIFGIFGFNLAVTWRLGDLIPKKARDSIIKNHLVNIGINVAIGMSIARINNSAHMGGLATGILLGLMMLPPRNGEKTELPMKFSKAGIALVLALGMAFELLKPSHEQKYLQWRDEVIEAFSSALSKGDIKGSESTLYSTEFRYLPELFRKRLNQVLKNVRHGQPILPIVENAKANLPEDFGEAVRMSFRPDNFKAGN